MLGGILVRAERQVGHCAASSLPPPKDPKSMARWSPEISHWSHTLLEPTTEDFGLPYWTFPTREVFRLPRLLI